MVPMDCAAARLALTLALLCTVSHQVVCEEEKIPEPADASDTPFEPSQPDDQQPAESRGLWESDLFFLDKLSNLFGGGGDENPKPSRQQAAFRPEPLPPQLFFSPNRRRSQLINKVKPSLKPVGSNQPPQNVPYFQLPFIRPTQGPPSQAHDAVPKPNQNFIAIHPPPPPPPPPPHPSRPSTLVTSQPTNSATRFPYKFIRPNGGTAVGLPPPPSKQMQPPTKTPSRVHVQHQPSHVKPLPSKPLKSKKPTLTEWSPDLIGAFSITQKPQISLPGARPRPQNLQLFHNRRPVLKVNQPPAKSKPLPNRPHPRPAPKPQKQHPRPPPQPQRIDMHPQKPTAIQKKPIIPGFQPSPKEGSLLADAFQPVFVASPSMDELGNDIMRPMQIISSRSSVTTTEKAEPVLIDFF